MLEYIPSKTYKNFLKEQGIELSPIDKATMIVNADAAMEDKIQVLQEMIADSSDKTFLNEVEGFISGWNSDKEKFSDRTGSAVYKLIVEMDDCKGYYMDLDMARTVGMGFREPFKIEKISIYRTKEDIRYVSGTRELIEDCIGGASYTKDGEILDIWNEPAITYLDYKNLQLNERYIGLRHPYYKGTLVKAVGKELYGISNDYKDADEQKKGIEKIKESGAADFVDDAVTIEFLMEDGHFSHDHVNPAYLEIVKEEELPDDIQELFKTASALIKGEGFLEMFQFHEEKYRENNEERHRNQKQSEG